MPFYYWRDKDDYNHKVVSIEQLDYSEDVYCLTVPEYGNFALDAGVFVHNCGMMSARSTVPCDIATPQKRLEFNRAVMEHVEMGVGGKSKRLPHLTTSEFENLIRGGAEYYCVYLLMTHGSPCMGVKESLNVVSTNLVVLVEVIISWNCNAALKQILSFSRYILVPEASDMDSLRTFLNWQRRSIQSNAILIWDTSRLTPPTGRTISMQSMREVTTRS
jgi:type IV secretory pathway VirB3-like protein